MRRWVGVMLFRNATTAEYPWPSAPMANGKSIIRNDEIQSGDID